MGCIESPVNAVSRVRFNPIKAVDGISDIARITKTGEYGGVIYVLTKRGTVYTNGSMARNMSLSGSTAEYASALVGLGLVTKAELKVHKQWIAAVKKYHDARDGMVRFQKQATALNVTLTAEQCAAIKATLDTAEQGLKDVRVMAQRLNADRQAAEAKAA